MIISNRSSGAVMSEFVIAAAFILVPLFVLLPLLAKYIETRQYTEQAARYAAWERTAWYKSAPKYVRQQHGNRSAVKSDQEIALEIQNRVFSRKQVTFYDRQKTTAIREKTNLMMQYYQPGEREATDLLTPQRTSGNNEYSINQSSVNQQQEGMSASFVRGVTRTLNRLAPDFELRMDGQYQSTINANFTEIAKWRDYGFTGLTISGTNTLLAEGWTGGGPGYVRNAVGDLNPIGRVLGFMDSVARFMDRIPGDFGSEFGGFDIDKVTIEPVPCSRLRTERRNRQPRNCRPYRYYRN